MTRCPEIARSLAIALLVCACVLLSVSRPVCNTVLPQGVSADLIATKYGFTRDDVDTYAVESQQRAANAWKNGYFSRSVVPVRDINGLTILDRDEHMRPETDMQSLASLNASFEMMGSMGGFDAVAIQAHPEVERPPPGREAG